MKPQVLKNEDGEIAIEITDGDRTMIIRAGDAEATMEEATGLEAPGAGIASQQSCIVVSVNPRKVVCFDGPGVLRQVTEVADGQFEVKKFAEVPTATATTED